MQESSKKVTRNFFKFDYVDGVLYFGFTLYFCTVCYEINGVCSSFFLEVALVSLLDSLPFFSICSFFVSFCFVLSFSFLLD